jgi:V/A-type H+-transporting ATPase subunit E
MSEDLQNLLDRIQEDGIAKADAQAKEIVAAAEKTAESIVAAAEQKAADTLAEAEKEAQVFTERSTRALEQAARDVVLSVGSAVTRTMDKLVGEKVAEALSDDLLEEMVEDVVKAYTANAAKGQRIEILLSPEDHDKLGEYFMSELHKQAKKALTIQSDDRILGGFEVSIVDGNVHHDFSQEAIAEALCQLVRPKLADIVRSALANKS